MPEGRYLMGTIEVLDGLEPVRKRPAMYVGDPTKPEALTTLVLEPLCLAVDEHTGGPARNVVVTLLRGNTVEVANDGPGLPLGSAPGRAETFIETIMLRLHACRDAKSEATKRWCGVGVAVVCALSEEGLVRVGREGGLWEQRFARGRVLGPIARVGDASSTSTTLLFRPDRTLLTGALDVPALAAKLREFEAEVPCTRVELRDLRAEVTS